MEDHYTAEFEFKASRKMLYPYISTASGLSQWFADDVVVNEDNIFTFIWDDEQPQARIASQRMNRTIKFEFLEDDAPSSPYLEMRLEKNDLTGTVYLVVHDSATTDDEEEFHDIWNQITDSLREIVGG